MDPSHAVSGSSRAKAAWKNPPKVITAMNSAETAEMPVTTALNPSFRRGSANAERYIRIIAMPFTESHSVIAAAKASGSASRAKGGTPPSEAAVAIISSPMVVAVSKPRPNRKPMT
ncbi:hypothetical protein FBY36_2161 [Arthrobacter sp. SLBN-122]|nr:hypothetical protein FBY36_2161 [Arthrobacter sp. SLBN-122]